MAACEIGVAHSCGEPSVRVTLVVAAGEGTVSSTRSEAETAAVRQFGARQARRRLRRNGPGFNPGPNNMMAFATVSAEIVLTIAIFALTNLAILAFRNPLRSGWLKSPNAQVAVEIVTISSVLIIVPALGAGIYDMISNLFVATVVFLGLVVVLYLGISHLMHMTERLALCDRGESPFRQGRTPAAGGTTLKV